MLNSNLLFSDAGLGGQPTTQNPQEINSGGLGGNNSSDVQPVSSTDLLSTNQAGVPLVVNSVPVIGLGSTTTSTQAISKPVVQHKTNDVMLGFAATLFVAAFVIFWAFSKQAKITTK